MQRSVSASRRTFGHPSVSRNDQSVSFIVADLIIVVAEVMVALTLVVVLVVLFVFVYYR